MTTPPKNMDYGLDEKTDDAGTNRLLALNILAKKFGKKPLEVMERVDKQAVEEGVAPKVILDRIRAGLKNETEDAVSNPSELKE